MDIDTDKLRKDIPNLNSTLYFIDFIQELMMYDNVEEVIDIAILCLAEKMQLLEKEELQAALENNLLWE